MYMWYMPKVWYFDLNSFISNMDTKKNSAYICVYICSLNPMFETYLKYHCN